ncbi:MAG: DUF4381 domain-containing protein [Gammaproteobacteria bacterium]|nr:DUF4381 domain-containing protein [Gammaproteobacteria bacterium]
MNDLASVLAKMRDIHPPEQVSWWPPALGWWLLVLILLFTWISWKLWKRRASSVLRTIAKKEFERLLRDFEIDRNKNSLLQEISIFLRRTALAANSATNASLTGISWLQCLDELSKYKMFENGAGRIISELPYQANQDFEAQSLLKELRVWVNKLK